MNKRGFSLIELLLVLTLSPIVFFSIYSNFSAGVRLWQRLQTPVPEEDVALFIERTRHDVESAMRYTPVAFQGTEEEFSFCTAMEAPEELGGRRGMGEVRYYYDPSSKALFRVARDLSQLYRDTSGKPERLLSGVSELKIHYQIFDKLSEGYLWAEEYTPPTAGALPYAVRVEFTHEATGRLIVQTYIIGSGGSFT